MEADAKAEKERYREFAPELELLLWAVWDPITGVPLTEYANYVPTIWKLLAQDVNGDVIASELGKIRADAIGMEAAPDGDRAAAERLKEWWYWRFVFPMEFEAASQ